MARLPRFILAGTPHLLIQPALEGLPAFVDAADRQAFLDTLREASAIEGVQMHAYALRPDEFCLLLTPSAPESLGRLMQAIGRRYVSAYNRRHGRAGPLWRGRYRCAAIEPGLPCLEALLWLDTCADPVDASSAAHHTGERRDPMLVDPPVYWALGNTPFEREAAYRRALSTGLPASRAAEIRRTALGGWAIGSPSFAAEAAATCGRATRPRPRGRPPGPARGA